MPRIRSPRRSSSRWLPLVSLVVCLGAGVSFLKLNQDDLDPTRLLQQQPPKKLADGCYHVFLDAGANIGIHSRFLFEPDHYPKAQNAHVAFDTAFGKTRDPRDICAFAFEPNPAHRERHQALKAAYDAMGWRYFPIEAGLGDTEGGSIDFYHNDPDPTANGEWGFSVVDRYGNGNKEVVPSIHFSKWIEKEILGRQMPDKVFGTYGKEHSRNNGRQGKVALKLDVEGMEFLVAPSLIFSGIMCRAIDVAWGEFHAQGHIPVRPALDLATGQGELPLFEGNWEVPRAYWNTLWKAMKSLNPQDCRARWLDLFDVEDYVHDGIPFPTSSKSAT